MIAKSPVIEVRVIHFNYAPRDGSKKEAVDLVEPKAIKAAGEAGSMHESWDLGWEVGED